jgi:hypothetical protein
MKSHQPHTSTAFPPWERAPGTHWIRGSVAPRVDLDVLGKSLTIPPWSKPGSPSPLSNHYIDYATSSPSRNILFSTVLLNVNQQTIPSPRMWHHGVCQKFTDVLGECSPCLLNSFVSKYFWIGGRRQKDYFVVNEGPTIHLPISIWGRNLSHTIL